jgi:hypothetical protein
MYRNKILDSIEVLQHEIEDAQENPGDLSPSATLEFLSAAAAILDRMTDLLSRVGVSPTLAREWSEHLDAEQEEIGARAEEAARREHNERIRARSRSIGSTR